MNTARSHRQKHVPIRTCVVCGAKSDKRALTRIVRTAEGVQVDLRGKMDGRGAYLCEQEACWQNAAKGNALAKALRITLTDADRNRLLQALPYPNG